MVIDTFKTSCSWFLQSIAENCKVLLKGQGYQLSSNFAQLKISLVNVTKSGIVWGFIQIY